MRRGASERQEKKWLFRGQQGEKMVCMRDFPG